MPDRYIARDSAESVGVRVKATTVAGTAVDPTSYAVAVAVLPVATADPSDADFKAATWQTGPRGTFAALLVGPGSAVGILTAGTTYRVWAKITASPEVPVISSPDRLIVY